MIDDDPLWRSVVASEIRHDGIATVEAGSGPEALAILAHRPVAALLVDQSMPGMSGLELTQRVRRLASYRLTPVLFVSADGEPTTRVEALQAGATDFMVKPISTDEMVARLRTQLRISTAWESRAARLRQQASRAGSGAALSAGWSPAAAGGSG